MPEPYNPNDPLGLEGVDVTGSGIQSNIPQYDPNFRGKINPNTGLPYGWTRVAGPGGRTIVVDEFGYVVDATTVKEETTGGGGGGNPELDQAKLVYGQEQDKIANDLATAQQNTSAARQAADAAYQTGNQDLARQAQASLDYWEGVEAKLQQAANDLTARGQDMTHQTNIASINEQRQDSLNRYNVGMANAANGEEANRISLIHEQEMAAIAKMEDETERGLGLMAGQTDQFSAETTRATGMGQLALQNNQFLLNAASTPRDLLGAYFLQRGLTPDWNTAMSGGQLPQGDPLVPVNPMTAYKPVTAPYDFSKGLPTNQYTGQVGGASGAHQIAENKFLQGTPPQASAVNLPATAPYTPGAPIGQPPAWNGGGGGGSGPGAPPNQSGEYGIRASGLNSGWNLITTLPGRDFSRGDIGPGYKIYDQDRNEILSTDTAAMIKKDSPYWVFKE